MKFMSHPKKTCIGDCHQCRGSFIFVGNLVLAFELPVQGITLKFGEEIMLPCSKVARYRRKQVQEKVVTGESTNYYL